METERDKLFKQNDDMRWEQYGLRVKLRDLQRQIDDAKYYLLNPLELQKKYVDVFDYVKKWLNNRYGSKLKFTTEKEMFDFLYAERKNTHTELKELKVKRKLVKDKLSKIPKTKHNEKIAAIEYINFEEIFLELFDYDQYTDGRKGFDYEESFRKLIKRTYDYFVENNTTYVGPFKNWLKQFYNDNRKGTHQIWLKTNTDKKIWKTT